MNNEPNDGVRVSRTDDKNLLIEIWNDGDKSSLEVKLADGENTIDLS